MPSYPPEFEKVVHAISDKLDFLATKGTPDAIAGFLTAKRIKGKRWGGTSCPVYHYIEPTAGQYEFKVSRTTIYIWPRSGTERFAITNPLVVADFIEKFDCCHYPVLVGKGE